MPDRQSLAQRIASTFAEDVELALEFYLMASELLDDFEEFGPVIQADEGGEYSESTAISRLRAARKQIIERLRSRL